MVIYKKIDTRLGLDIQKHLQYKKNDSEMDKETDRKLERQGDGREIDRQIDRQINSKIDRDGHYTERIATEN